MEGRPSPSMDPPVILLVSTQIETGEFWVLKGEAELFLVFTSASNQVDTKVTAKGLYAVRRFFHLLFGCLNSYLVKSLFLD